MKIFGTEEEIRILKEFSIRDRMSVLFEATGVRRNYELIKYDLNFIDKAENQFTIKSAPIQKMGQRYTAMRPLER